MREQPREVSEKQSMLLQAAHALETASMRGAVTAAQEAAEELRARAEEQARAAAAGQEVALQRLEQLQADASALEAAKGVAFNCWLHPSPQSMVAVSAVPNQGRSIMYKCNALRIVCQQQTRMLAWCCDCLTIHDWQCYGDPEVSGQCASPCDAGEVQACADAAAERIAFLEEQVTSLLAEQEAAAAQAEAMLMATQDEAATRLAELAAGKADELVEAAAQLAAAQVNVKTSNDPSKGRHTVAACIRSLMLFSKNPSWMLKQE